MNNGTLSAMVILAASLLTACEIEEKDAVEKEDTTGPVFHSSVPSNLQENVGVKDKITIYFNKQLNDQVPNSSLQLREMQSGDLISGAVDIRGATLVYSPETKLKYETQYYIESDYEISDSKGNNIGSRVYVEFNTQAAPVIEIEGPGSEQSVSGVITVNGTANNEVEQVLVQLSNSGFVKAEGTSNWTIDFDTSKYPDGVTTISAKATNGYWDIMEENISVSISNIDPMVGEWSCIKKYDSGQINNPTTQIFFSSGNMNDALFSCWVSGWAREGSSVVIRRSNCSDQIFTPSFPDSNTLNFRVGDWTAACTKN